MTAPPSPGAGRLHCIASALLRQSARDRHALIPPAITAVRGSLLVLGFTAAITAAGCGSSAAPAVSSNSSGSSQTATPGTAGPAASGGVADTPPNPDRSYICAAAAANSSGQTIGYLTVAGSDNAGAQSECSVVAQGSGWSTVASSPFHENLYTPVCFITFDAGHLTARIYTSDTASFADGVGLSNPLLQGFNVPTLPPS
jgi:hypothetical protein